jgi:hypothetical protein
MYKEVDTILLVNSYLIKCKIKNPNSPISRAAQKYLTRKINQTLNGKKQNLYYLFPIFSLIFIR